MLLGYSLDGWRTSAIHLSRAAAFAGSARQRRTTRPRLGAAPRNGARLQKLQAGGTFMKISVRILLAAAIFSLVASFSQAEPRQIAQGTQVHLKLLSDVSNGDSFIAVTTEPIMIGNELMVPAGTRIRGIVSSISRARHFALLRGEAYMNLSFRSMEIDSRLIPVQMSILALSKPSEEGEGRSRKDVNVTEGQMLQEKHDIKGDIIAGTIGTGGSTLIGKIASHAAAGFGIGLAGSAIYVAQRKGREVTLPADTGMLVRMDNSVTVPGVAGAVGSVNGSR